MHKFAKFFLYKILKWKILGDSKLPKKCVIIVGPHTHWQDFIYAIIIRKVINQEIKELEIYDKWAEYFLSMKQDLKIFDGHNDVLFRLYLKNKKNVHEDFLLGDNEGHLDLPRMKKAGFSGGFFAIYVPSQEEKIESADKPIKYDDMKNDSYELPLPNSVDASVALPIVLKKIQILKKY